MNERNKDTATNATILADNMKRIHALGVDGSYQQVCFM